MAFCNDGLEQWLTDLTWVSNADKVRALLLDIFSRRDRFSPVQGRLWCRVIRLYWREGWTLRQIGDHFGVGRENVRRIVKSLRHEAARFFGQSTTTGQALPIVEPARKSRVPITPDPTNESQEYWNAVLASHGLPDPDRRARGWSWKNPLYKFEWQSGTSVHAFGWSEFYETQAHPKPTFHTIEKTGGTGSWGKAKQIGTKTVQISCGPSDLVLGDNHDVRVFETGRACTFAWNADLRDNQSSPTPDDPGFLVHAIDKAKDGDPKAWQDYEREHERLEVKKYVDPKGFPIVPAIQDPCGDGRPFIQDFFLHPANRGTDVWINTDGTVYERGSNQPCGRVDPISSDETTRIVSQIGLAKQNAMAIPTRDDLIAVQQHSDRQQASHFLAPPLSRSSRQKGNTMQVEMDHKQAAAIVKALDIPRTTVARIAKMHASDVSSWLNGNLDFSQEKIERISQTVADIANVVKTLTRKGIPPDLRNVDGIRHLICVANDTETQLDLALEQPEPLREIGGGTAA